MGQKGVKSIAGAVGAAADRHDFLSPPARNATSEADALARIRPSNKFPSNRDLVTVNGLRSLSAGARRHFRRRSRGGGGRRSADETFIKHRATNSRRFSCFPAGLSSRAASRLWPGLRSSRGRRLRQRRTRAAARPPTILRPERRGIEVNGKAASVFGIRQPGGAFGLITDVGKPFRVRVENGIDQPSLIHWHGLTPPWRQDGVPGISGPPISPGESADYDFPRCASAARSGCTPHLGPAGKQLPDVCTAHHPRCA